MFSKNKVKHNMYKILKSLNKTNDYELTKNKLLNSMSEVDFNYAIYECDRQHLLDGFICTKGAVNNNVFIKVPKRFYITISGYEFIKSYYSNIKNLLRDLFLILTTAIITVVINNKWSNTDECRNIIDKVIS